MHTSIHRTGHRIHQSALTFSRFGPPQNSDPFAAQGMSQSVKAVEAPPFAKVFPQ